MSTMGSYPWPEATVFAATAVYARALHEAHRDRCEALVPELVAALDAMVMICGRTGNAFDDFEEQAERFHRETGVMRPGKDMAAASSGESDDGKRRARYHEWLEEKIANARAVIAKAKDTST